MDEKAIWLNGYAMCRLDRYKKVKGIANYYGLRKQLRQTVEEMAELTQVICKAERYDLDTVRDHLVEEVADVSIMIDQLEYLLGDNMIAKIKEEKIKRQLERIENGRL